MIYVDDSFYLYSIFLRIFDAGKNDAGKNDVKCVKNTIL